MVLMTAAGCLTAGSAERRTGFSPGADILWMSTSDQARELDAMVATGTTWLRLDLPWPSVQPSAREWNWAPFDRIISTARARHMQVLGVLSYVPAWGRRPAARGVAPFNTAAFAAFGDRVARRYSPLGLHHWEVWNEQNLAQSWGATPDAEAYTSALKRMSVALRAADPAAIVLSGGLAPATNDASEIAPITFATRMYNAGGGKAIDAVAVHPYSYPAMPADPSTASWNTFLGMSRIRDLMVARGDGDKKIWVTEMGAPTGSAAGASSDEMQARYVTSTFTAWRARPWTGPMFWYSIRDLSTDRQAREDNFGLLRRDFSQKPAYGAFVRAVQNGR
jgi:hypothetical protein